MIKETKKARYVSCEITEALSDWNDKHNGLNRVSVLFRFINDSTSNSKLATLLAKHKASNNEFRLIMELGNEPLKSFAAEMSEAFDSCDDQDLPTFTRLTATVSELTDGKYTRYKTSVGEYTSIRLSYFSDETPDDWKGALVARWNAMQDDIELAK